MKSILFQKEEEEEIKNILVGIKYISSLNYLTNHTTGCLFPHINGPIYGWLYMATSLVPLSLGFIFSPSC